VHTCGHGFPIGMPYPSSMVQSFIRILKLTNLYPTVYSYPASVTWGLTERTLRPAKQAQVMVRSMIIVLHFLLSDLC
jgi:hypothetical protein